MKAIIADDEPNLAQYLRDRLVLVWPELDVAALAGSGTAAAAAIREYDPDIAFLDIRMPGATGLEVAQGLRGRPRVVFVTAYDQYAIDAFERDAVDYLLKPVTDERLARTVEKLKRLRAEPAPDVSTLARQLAQHLQSQTAPRYLRWIRASRRGADGEVTQQIPVDDVLYFQSDNKYTSVYARQGAEVGEWLIRVSLSELAAQLAPGDFVQVHRSVIVNMNAVAGSRRDLTGKLYLRLRGHERELPVARQYAHLFRQM
jgi:DNA-binding LytR/AlgR family response regulator